MPDTPVGDGTANYLLTTADLAATIYCKVTATNASGTANADSNTVGPVTAAPVAGPATTNMWCWLKADAGVYTDAGTTLATNGQRVQRWADQSATGTRHWNQTSANNKPTFVTGVVNSLPVVRFTTEEPGVDLAQHFNGPDASALTAGEAFIVFKVDNDPATGTDGFLWDIGVGSLASLFPYTDGKIYDEFGTDSRRNAIVKPSLSSQFRLYNVVSTTTEWACYLDGTSLLSDVSANTVVFSAACILGASTGVIPSSSIGMKGDIAEFILYSAKCSAPDKAQTKTYLAAKYGLTIA